MSTSLATALDLGPVRRGLAGRLARAILACALVLVVAAGDAAAQAKRPRGSKLTPAAKAALAARRAAKKAASTAPPTLSLRPRAPEPRKPSPEELARRAADWERLTSELAAAHYARRPDLAFEEAWPKARELGFGIFGADGGQRWRAALARARTTLAQLDLSAAPWDGRARAQALSDWVEAELLLVDTQQLAISDPAAYVELAFRTLRAAAEARWLSDEERRGTLEALLEALPRHLSEARLVLLDPAPPWIDLALRALEDLEQLVAALAPAAPPAASASKPKPTRPQRQARVPADEPAPDPRAAIAHFRSWLLGLRAGAGGLPPTLDAAEHERLLALAAGRPLTLAEVETACLRDLARLELSEGKAGGRARLPAPRRLAARARSASLRAFQLAHEAQLLCMRPGVRSVEFACEESPRASSALVALRPGANGVLRVLLQLPNAGWPVTRTAARNRELDMLALTALGIRHGLAGEALFAGLRRASADPLARLPVNRALESAIGLYTQDWITRIDWLANPLAANERLGRTLVRERGLEAARLLAALELHAEGVSLSEAAANFRRRTGAGEELSAAEVLAAQRDPLRGLGYLGLTDLRVLEHTLSARTTPRRGLGLALQLVYRHPTLRPEDLARAPRRSAAER